MKTLWWWQLFMQIMILETKALAPTVVSHILQSFDHFFFPCIPLKTKEEWLSESLYPNSNQTFQKKKKPIYQQHIQGGPTGPRLDHNSRLSGNITLKMQMISSFSTLPTHRTPVNIAILCFLKFSIVRTFPNAQFIQKIPLALEPHASKFLLREKVFCLRLKVCKFFFNLKQSDRR